MADLNPGLLNTGIDWNQDFNQAALQGVARQKEVGGLHALQGVDLNDPASVNNAIGNSIKTGNLDQASALSNLNFTQGLRQSLPGFMDRLGSALSPQGQQPQAQQSPQAPQQSPVQAQAAHAASTMDLAANTVKSLRDLPQDQRAAALDQAREQFTQRGIPTEAIDSAAQHLDDKSLDDSLAFYQSHGAHLNNVANGQEVATPATMQHPQTPWYSNLLEHPELMAQAAALKGVGYDITPLFTQARELAQPQIQQAAEIAAAGPKAQATAAAQFPYDIAKKNYELEFPLQNMNEEALAAAKKAGAVATAETAAKNAQDFMSVKGPNGQDVWVRKDYATQQAGEHGGVLGQSITPSEQKFREDQAQQAAKVLEPDEKVRQQASDSRNDAERALSIIGNKQFDNLTPVTKQLSDILRTAKIPNAEKYSTDIAGYQQLANQALTSGARAAFPQRVTDRDIKLMQNVFPTLTTPVDQAKVVFGMQAAKALRDQQYEDFKANYQGSHESPAAIQAEWLKQQGGQSVFQSPQWSKVNIGGRPAFNPATDVKVVNGQKIGAWGLGTGHPVYFEVK